MAACVAPSIDLPQILDEGIRSTVFTHRSLGLTRERSPDDPSRQPYNNLKLAHEGDAVIGNVVSQLLAKRYPELTLGQTAGRMVSNSTLTEICHAYGLFNHIKAVAAIQSLEFCDTKHHADLFEAYVGGLARCTAPPAELGRESSDPASTWSWLSSLFAIVAEHYIGDVVSVYESQKRCPPSIEWLNSSPSPIHGVQHNRALGVVDNIFRQQRQRLQYSLVWGERSQTWRAFCQAVINGQKCRFEAIGPSQKVAKRAAAALICRRIGISG